MRSNEFNGWICDECGEPVKAEKAEGKMIHATVRVNNVGGFEDRDFCTKTCFNKAVANVKGGGPVESSPAHDCDVCGGEGVLLLDGEDVDCHACGGT